ncbi:uncharacterized protein BCR38DRAFT_461379 [Pseudomassariella vexata]|uniref:Fibronectin type-III domain-containing protein n=1 Tax=Pseudomassariella vexata TaxID=1141098 RepID=A0A1Y2DDC1_9PEZI|nr:uncharacterized protein BCR38DRAFT_461379 [Pseudomassariella vexata]ORY57239.1 hypothetical protein BCR38DRAFT_461379 [Pseudomassariella vexata]
MSWTPWTTSVPTILVVCAVLAWWFTEPKTAHLNLIVTIGCILFFWAVAPDLAQDSPAWVYQASISLATFLHLDILVLYHANMLVTGAAVLWLAHRAWQTLWKPVPELISILGVDVPDPPDVSLAGIRADAATLHWTRPRPNRPVGKFLIQVNGVNVGESAHQETAITVTGLKPNHFYNVRVIAVGHNNFQAGSRVIRLRTFARDGRPQLGDGRLPSNFAPEEQQLAMPGDPHDEDGTPRSPAAGVETASFPESNLAPPTREASSSISIPRRNTLTRKHSPSTTSMDQSVKDALRRLPEEESLQKLGEKFESIRKEMEEIQAQIANDEKEHKEMMDELADEKRSKRRVQKEKDDTTEKLKREMGSTDRAMRSAQQRKTQKEKLLKERQNDRKKLHDEMRKRQAGFEKDKANIQQEGDDRASELREDLEALQASLAQEEAELKEKGKELKEAEDQRKTLPGGEESEEWRDTDRQIRRDWENKSRDLQRRLFYANRRAKALDDYENVLRSQLSAAQQSGLPFSYNQANSSGVEFDVATQNQLKRRSRNSNSMSNVVIPSPAASYAGPERAYTSSSSFTLSRPPTMPPGFAQGPFMDLTADMSAPFDEDGIKALTAGAPLSPTAASLLPAGMLDMVDDEPPSPASRPTRHNTFGSNMSPENDPQSPASSGRSISIISSPRGSSQNLPFSHYTGENSERRSLRGDFGTASSPIAPPTSASTRFFPWLHRMHKPTATDADEPPALGALKPAHSQSFPRSVEDSDISTKRKLSFSAGWGVFNRNCTGPGMPDAGHSSSVSIASRRLGLFTNGNSGSNVFDQDPSSPRPVSIASSDLPRPSTDSSSIWAKQPPQSRLWSPEAGDPWASRSASRRPSIHGSPSALKTTLADADDEILHDSEIHQPPSRVGIIGHRPPSKSLAGRLNPNAPSFNAPGSFMTLFRPKEKDGKESKDKDKAKGKAKNKDKDYEPVRERKPRPSITSASETDESPSESRKSRDTFSVHTPSVTESRESLSLDQALSNAHSDLAVGLGFKEHESGIKKLLRKGSTSKFSLHSISSIRGVGGKKGPSSVTNSDKNMSMERASFDENAEEGSTGIARSYESPSSSPSLGPMSAGKAHAKEKSWRFSMKKKPGKEKESLDLDHEENKTSAGES